MPVVIIVPVFSSIVHMYTLHYDRGITAATVLEVVAGETTHLYFAYFTNILILYQIVSNASAVNSINSRVDTHLCKLRDTPAARFYPSKIHKSPGFCQGEQDHFYQGRLRSTIIP